MLFRKPKHLKQRIKKDFNMYFVKKKKKIKKLRS